MNQNKRVIIRVDVQLLEKLRKIFPETEKLTYSGMVDVILRKIAEANKQGE